MDAGIIRSLFHRPRATVVGVAEALAVSRSTVQTRLARLEAMGILGYGSLHRIPALLGYGITAFIAIEARQSDSDHLCADLRRIPEVVEAYAMTGADDVLCKVVARSTADLGRIARRIAECDVAQRVRTSVIVADVLPHRLEPLLDAHTEHNR
ncbi:Lrp/AsnC family transcriptional regulator [Gordonia sp. KTR9]|uniref:Lrp/AsnC family transcriptional regulator n=1 Tax=Gordonia sp. KTR9 TaxID=337191 RepID=UPI0005C8E442